MNGIEKAEWAAGPRRRDAGRAGTQGGSWLGLPCSGPGGAPAPRRRERGLGVVGGITIVGGAPQPGHSAPAGLPFICWLCHFLSIADPFSVPSVISNNVTASLESIHQSRKKPMLTLIKKKKKKMPSVPPGEELSTQPLAPLPAPATHPPAISWGCRGVIRFRRRPGVLPQVVPPLPAHSPKLGGDGL